MANCSAAEKPETDNDMGVCERSEKGSSPQHFSKALLTWDGNHRFLDLKEALSVSSGLWFPNVADQIMSLRKLCKHVES